MSAQSSAKIPIWRNFKFLLVLTLLVILLVIGYFYGLEANDNDRVVYVALRGYLSSEQRAALEQQLNGYVPDYWEDGVRMEVFEFPAGSAGAQTSELFTALVTQIHSGDADLVLLDLYVYDLIGDETLFADLSQKYPEEAAVSQRNLYAIKNTTFCKPDALGTLPELYFVIRSEQSPAVQKNAASAESYRFFAEMLDDIVSGAMPKGYAEIGPQSSGK